MQLYSPNILMSIIIVPVHKSNFLFVMTIMINDNAYF